MVRADKLEKKEEYAAAKVALQEARKAKAEASRQVKVAAKAAEKRAKQKGAEAGNGNAAGNGASQPDTRLATAAAKRSAAALATLQVPGQNEKEILLEGTTSALTAQEVLHSRMVD